MGLGVRDLWYLAGAELQLPPARLPLPRWARFIAELAADMPLVPKDEPTTAVITVPTRDYAAAIAAAAIVIRRDELDPAAPDELEPHLELLRALEPDTRVQYTAPGGKVFEGRWLGFSVGHDGLERACMELRKSERRSILIADALRIVPSGESRANGKLRVRNVETSPLLRGMRGQAAAVPFVTTVRTEVVIVGTSAHIHAEMCEQGLFLSGNIDDPHHGYLQDLARVQQFPGATRYYRSVLIPPSSKLSEEQRALTPRVVIYDGGRMFLQCSHLWPESHRLVILDRSVTSSEDAALELAQEWASRDGESALGEDLTVPEGVEFIAFRRQL